MYTESSNDNLEWFFGLDHVGMLSSFRQVWNFNVGFEIVTINAILKKFSKINFSSVSNEHNALYYLTVSSESSMFEDK